MTLCQDLLGPHVEAAANFTRVQMYKKAGIPILYKEMQRNNSKGLCCDCFHLSRWCLTQSATMFGPLSNRRTVVVVGGGGSVGSVDGTGWRPTALQCSCQYVLKVLRKWNPFISCCYEWVGFAFNSIVATREGRMFDWYLGKCIDCICYPPGFYVRIQVVWQVLGRGGVQRWLHYEGEPDPMWLLSAINGYLCFCFLGFGQKSTQYIVAAQGYDVMQVGGWFPYTHTRATRCPSI